MSNSKERGRSVDRVFVVYVSLHTIAATALYSNIEEVANEFP